MTGGAPKSGIRCVPKKKKPLRYSLQGARRLRVGDYRVIYRIEPPDVVLVVKIGHRREVYEE